MAQTLSVIELGHPVLRQRSQPVLDVGCDRIQTLIDDLIYTVQAANGVGIAAPQTAQGDRLFIVASRPNPRYPQAPDMVPTAMINPQIIDHSAQMASGWEGCLSVPGMRGWVPRYRQVTVEYIGRDGRLNQQTLTDFVARIFQHELDHLDGLIFLDRVPSTQDLMSEKEYQAQIIGSQP